jgi:hypothetical protein
MAKTAFFSKRSRRWRGFSLDGVFITKISMGQTVKQLEGNHLKVLKRANTGISWGSDG